MIMAAATEDHVGLCQAHCPDLEKNSLESVRPGRAIKSTFELLSHRVDLKSVGNPYNISLVESAVTSVSRSILRKPFRW